MCSSWVFWFELWFGPNICSLFCLRHVLMRHFLELDIFQCESDWFIYYLEALLPHWSTLQGKNNTRCCRISLRALRPTVVVDSLFEGCSNQDDCRPLMYKMMNIISAWGGIVINDRLMTWNPVSWIFERRRFWFCDQSREMKNCNDINYLFRVKRPFDVTPRSNYCWTKTAFAACNDSSVLCVRILAKVRVKVRQLCRFISSTCGSEESPVGAAPLSSLLVLLSVLLIHMQNPSLTHIQPVEESQDRCRELWEHKCTGLFQAVRCESVERPSTFKKKKTASTANIALWIVFLFNADVFNTHMLQLAAFTWS